MDFALEGRKFIVEAKHCWPHIGGRQNAMDFLRKNTRLYRAHLLTSVEFQIYGGGGNRTPHGPKPARF